MRKILIPVLLLYSLTFAREAQISIPLKAVNGPYFQQLYVGLDTCATNGIDTCCGELGINPPPPPPGAFDARFDLSPYGYTAYTNKDYRHADFPFTGTTQHTLKWQMGLDYNTLVVEYNLPANCSMNIKDALGGTIFNSGPLTGSGNYTIPAPLFNQAIVTMTYTNISSPEPFFSINTDSLDFGNCYLLNTKKLYPVITNNGNSPLIIYFIVSSNTDFTVTQELPCTLQVGESKSITVNFKPSTIGLVTGMLTFVHSALSSPDQVSMKGNSVYPQAPYLKPQVYDSIKVEDQVWSPRTLYFGLDPTASDDLDSQFGEIILPSPPQGSFDARWILPENHFSGILSTYRDFRFMSAVPYSGQKEFRFGFQLGTGSPGAKISWNLPSYLTCKLVTMYFGDTTFMSGTGNVFITTPDAVKFKIFATYTSVLPVELTSFNATVKDCSVILHWQTSSEKNNKGFDVERKCSWKEWESIAFISGAGTSTETHFYSYEDKDLSWGSYTYRLKQIDLDGTTTYSKEITADVLQPDKYILEQNYPNPFNPATTISYTIPKAGLVNLRVYNSIGEEVSLLVNKVQESGKYIVQFNASELPSGIYMYKITSGDFVQTKKMLLIK